MEYLVLSHVRFIEPTDNDYFILGRQLAALHAVNAYTSYGWPHDNYIGAISQTNGSMASWDDFFAENRIGSIKDFLATFV